MITTIATFLLATQVKNLRLDQPVKIEPSRLKFSVNRKHALNLTFPQKIKFAPPIPALRPNFKFVVKTKLPITVDSFVYPAGKLTADLLPNIEKANLEIEDQGERGTCTLFASKFLIEYENARAQNFKKTYRYNPEYLLWTIRDCTPNYIRDGAQYDDAKRGFDHAGIINWGMDKVYGKAEADYDPTYVPKPSSKDLGKTKIKDVTLFSLFDHGTALTDDEFCEMLEVINSGVPVGMGIAWGNDKTPPGKNPVGHWYTVNEDGVDILDYTGIIENGHAMACTGYKIDDKVAGGGYFVFHNSWGSAPQGGYLYLTFRKIKTSCHSAYIALPKTWPKM